MAITSVTGKTAVKSEPAVTRILVLLDDTRGARAALETAADLAAHQHAELVGLFVEDTDLLRSAGLPFSHEISMTSGQTRPLEAALVERELRERARLLEQALASAGTRRALRWRFEVGRDRLERAADTAAEPRDTLVVGRNGWRRHYGPAMGSVASRLARATRCSVLVVGEERPRHDRPVVVLQPGGDDPSPTLDTAIRLARDRSRPLCILLRPGSGPSAELERLAGEWSRRVGTPIRFEHIADTRAPTLVEALHRAEGQALVISRASEPLATAEGYRLLDELDVPVLVID
ncbi:hypothetical protein KBTX_03648 [wastewater metagenome]|uniref:UspA domain-containing protein n=2 Tax=unclassified sequences TaxID=12908 RepID=A0A5B8RE48_9ZZZZ|nr:hypothetical protein KBTEX_03648 [uncultured organism]